MGDEGESVRVAVRVRPFNGRERRRNASCIIKMSGPTTTIVNPDNESDARPFTFDYSYWSHNGSQKLESGYYAPEEGNTQFAGQEELFSDIGQGVLENAWNGYNTSLFAYGQTGSGKSWSVVGYGINKGIVPRFCEELFEGIKKKQAEGHEGTFEVQFSMLEIYNEKVRDLLNPSTKKGGLKVRQNPKRGFYAQGLTVLPVSTYLDIEKRTEEGTKNRTVASTKMNATSSRAHTIVGVVFTQKIKNDAGQETAKTSVVNLVDLAGSERADSTGATGSRLKEGAAINKSLSSLGNCIAALAEKSQGKKVRVPFRDSVLTKLLKNALGGNSKTIMIAALSPADINYDETLSTLRYADRAKQIKTKATVNENPTEKLIRELKEENDRLRALMQKSSSGEAVGKISEPTEGEEDDDDEEEEEEENKGLSEDEIKKRVDDELAEWLAENEKQQQQAEKQWEEKLKELEEERKEKDEEEKKVKDEQKTTPHFFNLNPDPMLTGMIVHLLKNETCTVGKTTEEKKPDVNVYGLNIQEEHATINFKEGNPFLIPSKDAKILVNGEPAIDETRIHHQDRVMFGSNQLFVLHLPNEIDTMKDHGYPIEDITYEMAQEEIAQQAGFTMQKEDNTPSEEIIIQEKLSDLLPLIEQANAISEELDKKVEFGVAVVSAQALGKNKGRKEVHVTVQNLESGYRWLWKDSKFINRKYVMDEMYEDFTEGGEWQLPEDRDPFVESMDTECLIGTFEIYLKCIAYQLKLEETLAVTDFMGNLAGTVNVVLTPVDKGGQTIPEDKIEFESPEQMIGKRIDFNIEITNANKLPAGFTDIYCQYSAFTYEDLTSSEISDSCSPEFKYTQQITLNDCTQEMVDIINEDPIIVKIYGKHKGDDKKPVNSQAKEGKSTKQIFAAQVLKKGFGYMQQQKEKLCTSSFKQSAENALLRKQLEILRKKIDKVKSACKKEESNNKDVVKIQDIYIALGSQKAPTVTTHNNNTTNVQNGKETGESKSPEEVKGDSCVCTLL